MNSIISTTKSANSTAEELNKSEALIAGLIASDPVTERRFYSYDPQYGIFKTLFKVFEKAPQCVKNHIRNLASGEDPASYLATELVAKKLFTAEKLNTCFAQFDGSLFSLVKVTATNHLIDIYRKIMKLETDNLEDDFAGNPEFTLGKKLECDERLTTDSHQKYEDRDLIEHIIADANLGKFQTYIIKRDEEGYKPKEIVSDYSAANGRSYKIAYCYTQKSLAMSRLLAAAKNLMKNNQ